MKKNLILMSALFAGSMFLNDGFCANDGIPFAPTCDGVINYVRIDENGNNLSARTTTTRLGKIAGHRDWLNGLSQDDKIALRAFINGLRVTNERSPRNGYINTIDHLIVDIMQNNEVQNNAVDVVVNPAANIVPNPEIDGPQLDALQDDRRRAHHEIEDVNDEDGAYYVKRIKKIATKSKEKLHQAGEAVKPAIDYVKNNPVQSISYTLGGVSIAKGIHYIYHFAKGCFGW